MTVAIDVLLWLAVAIDLLCVVGVVAMDDVFGRLHFIGPTAVAMLFITTAIVLQEGASQLSVKTALIWVFVLVVSPVATHATARAARVRQAGGWAVLPEEKKDARR